jgi:uncharacterized iron-regulated membrane protein
MGAAVTVRNIILKVHLLAGVAAAVFVMLLGATGSVIAWENDIDHWLDPQFFRVQPGPRMLAEADLIHAVEQRFAPARVTHVHIFREANLARMMDMTDHSTVAVDPYDGTISGVRLGPSTTQKWVGYIHQLHTHLVPDPRIARRAGAIGGQVVEFAGALVIILVPTGFILWWRAKRLHVKWSAAWYRISFDLHQSVGILVAVPLFALAMTGVLVAEEGLFYKALRSPGPSRFPQVKSVPSGEAAIGVDRAMEIARAAIPNATATELMLPLNPQSTYQIVLRVPEETSEAAHSVVFVDQYSGHVLYASNFLTGSPGYRAVRFNRSIHTGDVWGTAGHAIASLVSLAATILAITGVVIWLKKLAGQR